MAKSLSSDTYYLSEDRGFPIERPKKLKLNGIGIVIMLSYYLQQLAHIKVATMKIKREQ